MASEGSKSNGVSGQRPAAGLKRADTKESIDLDNYFSGPMDSAQHSDLPYYLRIHGSVLPKMILPLLFVAGWATAITIISKRVYDLGISSTLLTVLGFVVGLSLSFRSSTAYERYAEGRKYWAQLMLTGRNLSRVFWIHAKEREGDLGKEDLLGKLTALNLILAFCIATKHKLRFEPEYDYKDLKSLIENLETFAKSAYEPDAPPPKGRPAIKTWAAYLGIPGAEDNPAKSLRRSNKHHGHLPLEILTYLSAYLESILQNETFKTSCMQTVAINSLNTMADTLTGCERILMTPLPAAYNIAISQITWLYVLVLPFQLYSTLDWIAIPGTIVAAYIILGLAAIGREIENPFGRDVNDLDLDRYCNSLAMELNILISKRPQQAADFVNRDDNMVMWPLSLQGYNGWAQQDLESIRTALKIKSAAQKDKIDEIREEESRATENGQNPAGATEENSPEKRA